MMVDPRVPEKEQENILAEVLIETFFARLDCFIEQAEIDEEVTYLMRKNLADKDLIKQHIRQQITIGPLCLGKDNAVKFACVDIDIKTEIIDKIIEDKDKELYAEVWHEAVPPET